MALFVVVAVDAVEVYEAANGSVDAARRGRRGGPDEGRCAGGHTTTKRTLERAKNRTAKKGARRRWGIAEALEPRRENVRWIGEVLEANQGDKADNEAREVDNREGARWRALDLGLGHGPGATTCTRGYYEHERATGTRWQRLA